MARRTVAPLLLIGLGLPLPALGANGLGQGQSDFGGVGLMQTPTARMAPLGELTFAVNRTSPFRRYSVSLQPAEWFEFNFRYVEIGDRRYGESIAGDRDYLDKGLDAKLRLWSESRYLPELAVGLRDAGGTSLFGAEYLVASKRWNDFDFSLGIGWGYLGARGDLGAPLGLIADRFEDRPGDAGGDQGGEFALNQLFRGSAALFSGMEYQTPWEPLSLQLEYEGNDYGDEPAGSPISQDSPFNVGMRYHLTDNLALRLGWQRGNTAMAGITYGANLTDIGQAKREARPVTLQQPNASGSYGDSGDDSGDDSVNAPGDWQQASRQLQENAGINADRIVKRGSSLVVEGEATRFRSLAKTEGRANRILHNHAGEDIDTFRYRWQEKGLTLREDVHDRDAFVAAAASAEDEPNYRYSLYSLSATGDTQSGETLHEQSPQRFRYSLGPGINQNLGGPDGYLYQLLLRANAELYTDANGWFSGTLAWTLLDNFENYEYISDSDLPRVRTFLGDYLAESSLGLTNLQYTRTEELGQDWYAMGYGGLLEMMYAGVGGELLYRPFNSPWALGADLNYVKQRDFEQRFGLRDYTTWTGHLSAYVETGFEDVLAKVSVGRYLAKDVGATFDFSREFASGARMGAWATFTDAGDDYGEGSFDKGVYISLPLDAFFTTSSRNHVNIAWQPLTRDGGARLSRRYQLYDLTQDSRLGRYWEETDRAWE